MDTSPHNMQTLFDQLGLDSSPAAIEQFIADHRPLPREIELAQAPFWNDSQASFLSEGIAADAAWAEIIDELDARLRH